MRYENILTSCYTTQATYHYLNIDVRDVHVLVIESTKVKEMLIYCINRSIS